ncbi:MAG TPA: CBS domain-containing protein [Burkholderiales bacterium]|nr:CBS domain-containing protein [Burkholderiales bacterium]
MFRDYAALPLYPLPAGTTFHQPSQTLPQRVNLDDRAAECMTDLKQVSAATIEPSASIDTANQTMIEQGVRLLLVLGRAGEVAGIITANDILGEKLMQFMQESGVRRHEVLVQDIMTPRHQLEALNLDDVVHAKVGHVVAMLKKSGRQHAVVVDNAARKIRGIFSATQIARQLGVTIQTTEVARTFAEIEAVLSR